MINSAGPAKFLVMRCDGYHHIGMGHIMRCIAFAQSFKGRESVFVIKDYEEKVSKLIRDYGYDVDTIPSKSSFEKDAALTLNFADKYNADMILTDLGNKDRLSDLEEYIGYINLLKKSDKFVITIDGYGPESVSKRASILSDMVIIPYCGAENEKYKLNTNTRYLLGPSYFIFRQEFIKKARVDREIKKNAQNILITMGGSDPFNFTVKAAKALLKLKRDLLNLRIVIGPGFDRLIQQELDKVLKDFNGNYEFITGNFDMAELMFWSDLAIISSGLTKYETAVTGTPSIIISYNNFQEEIMGEFQKYGASIHLGQAKNILEDDMARAVAGLLDNSNIRKQMSEKGRRMVDGKGAARIISSIPKELLE